MKDVEFDEHFLEAVLRENEPNRIVEQLRRHLKTKENFEKYIKQRDIAIVF